METHKRKKKIIRRVKKTTSHHHRFLVFLLSAYQIILSRIYLFIRKEKGQGAYLQIHGKADPICVSVCCTPVVHR
jgi:hypothetical protein